MNKFFSSLIAVLLISSCIPKVSMRTENKSTPETYIGERDSTNLADVSWRDYFSDPVLVALIDTALLRNQELSIIIQEIEISRNEIRSRKGDYLPSVGIGAGAGIEKAGRYTRDGAVEENLDIAPDRSFPEPLPDYSLGAYATWEIDVWKKLRNAKKAAISHYLASIEGKNFMVTNLIGEIANTYYELMALENMELIIAQNMDIQSNAVNAIGQQKDGARVTQLAVNRFEAQLLHTKNLQFRIRQGIVEAENRLYFLTGKFPSEINSNAENFTEIPLAPITAGVPSQLLANRPDIRRAEQELARTKLEVKVAKANFYPSFTIRAGVGFQAFDPSFLFNPTSLIYGLTGELMAPVINRNGIKAAYLSANNRQVQAIYDYERNILSAHLDVLNQLSDIKNSSESFSTKKEEVRILSESIGIANNLFNSARADYAEVLLTQREALESRMELVEIKLQLLHAQVNIYRSLGGGWK